MKQPIIHDWHNPRNDDCKQNQNIDKDCTCKRTKSRDRKCDIINRKAVREKLLQEAASRQNRIYTQVRPETLDAIAAVVKQEIIRLASNAPRAGKTL